MAHIYNDRVKETTTSTGTGTVNLAGAATGFRTFVAGIGSGNTCCYAIENGTDWEVGIGTVTSGSPDTLSRTTILSSSNSNAAVNFPAGTKNVFVTVPADRTLAGDNNNTYELGAGRTLKLSSSAEYVQTGVGGFIKNSNGNVVFSGSGVYFEVTSTGPINLAGAKTTLFTSTTSSASLNIPHGTAPSSPVNGDVWTTTAGMYVRVNGSTVGPLGSGGGSVALDDLTDVTLSPPDTGEVLVYSGTEWTNNQITTGSISDFVTGVAVEIGNAVLDDLSDVVITTPSTGQVLKFNGTNWVNDTVSASAAWGSITGTLSSQTDLQTALDAKAPTASPTFTGVSTFASGSNSAPSITFTGDTNTGLYKSANEVIDFTVTGLRTLAVQRDGGSSNPEYCIITGGDDTGQTGIFAGGAAANINISVGAKGTASVFLENGIGSIAGFNAPTGSSTFFNFNAANGFTEITSRNFTATTANIAYYITSGTTTGARHEFQSWNGTNNRTMFQINHLASVTGAQNYIAVNSANPSSHPTIEAEGGDTNINLDLFAKGTGSIRFNGTATTISSAGAISSTQNVNFTSSGSNTIGGVSSTVNIGSTLSTVNIGSVSSTVNIGSTLSVVNVYGNFNISGEKTTTAAATTSYASLNIPHGTAPTTPANGDVWTTTAGMYVRVNGSTVGPLGSGGGGGGLLNDLTDVVISSPTNGQVLKYNGTNWVNDADAGSGSGSPGGSTTQIQFNDAASFGGDADLTWDKTNNHLGLNGTATLTALSNEPSTPSSGTGRLYARSVAARVVPKWIGPSGVDYMLQPQLGTNNIGMWRGGATTTATTFASTLGSMAYTGASPTAPTIPTLASTNLLTQTFRSTISTGATAGGLAYIRGNQLRVWRGNAAGSGGFFVVIRFALSGTLQSGLRCFAGLVDVASNPTNVDPTSTTTPGGIGLAIAANTGNWRLVNNITGTARTATDLGANFAINNSHLIELILFCAPNGSQIEYRVSNWSTGNQTSGSVSTNIPAATTFMTPSIWVTNNATAAVQQLDFVSCYVETDY